MQTAPTPTVTLTKELTAKIDQVLKAHNQDPTQLLGILLDVQDCIEQNYVPEAAAFYIAEKLPVKLSVIYDCLTFYSSLSDQPRAKYPIQICNSIVCHVNDAASVATAFQEILGIEIGETTYDGKFTLESVPCFGACDQAPAVRIKGKVYGHLDTREKIQQLIAQLI